jgi:DNA polymerase-3 subunit gamma/tau
VTAPAPAESQPSADSLRANWVAVLEAVKRERRVAWILLGNASVLSLQDGILTLRFTRDGDLKAFSASGHDAILKKVLSAGFGLNVTVKGVVGGDGGPGAPRSGPGAPGRWSEAPPRGGSGPPPQAARPAGSSPPESQSPPASPRGSAAPEFSRRRDEPPDDLPPEPDDMPDEMPEGPSGGRPAELTGMDLIQRELGGQVIGEIEE